MKPSRFLRFAPQGFVALGAALLSVSASHAAELLTNGDFEAGNVGFTSDYTFFAPPPDGLKLYPESSYAIGTDPSGYHNMFSSYGDHTTGTGQMMIVNGAVGAGKVVWTETVAVTPGSGYTFSGWGASAYPASPADLQFLVNGSPIGGHALSGGTAWENFSALWNSGAAGSAQIAIIDLNTEANGNDFTLDDLSFQPKASVVPEPGTIAFGVITGAGLLGLIARKRRA